MSTDTMFLQWLNDWNLYPRPYDLPDALNADGRPVWEPPILDYTNLIGDDYQKKREAVMKFTNHNVVETTKIMDLYTEEHLVFDYLTWSKDSGGRVTDNECKKFFEGLQNVLREDWFEVEDEWIEAGGVGFIMRGDGTYKVTTFPNPRDLDSETDEDEGDIRDGNLNTPLVLDAKNTPRKTSNSHKQDIVLTTDCTTSSKAIQEELVSLASLGISAAVSPLATLPSRLAQQIIDPSLALRLVSLPVSRKLVVKHTSVEYCIDDID